MVEPLRIVALGGGTGLSTLLQGLKQAIRESAREDVDVTAVVAVTDDGGSSGRLRREFDVLPPGDIRNCMVALSEDEALLSRLFQYRFSSGRGLKGHSFGNLFLTALTNLTGDFAQAVKMSSEILASIGRIYPATSSNVSLEAELDDGSVVFGETNISRSRKRIRKVALRPQGCCPLPETLDAIARADLITFGPGSLFTSIIPNLLVRGIPGAIRRSPALKACIMNLMSQPGETTGLSGVEHVTAIHRHARMPLLDCLVLNSSPIPQSAVKRYARKQAEPIEIKVDQLQRTRLTVIRRDLLATTELVRHDPRALAAVALELAAASRRKNIRSQAVRKEIQYGT